MKTFHTFQKGGTTINGKIVPCLLFVTEEWIAYAEGTLKPKRSLKISISGKANPFPFKEAVITNLRADLVKWLEDQGWEEIAREYR